MAPPHLTPSSSKGCGGTTRRRSPTRSRSSTSGRGTSASCRTRSAACCPTSAPIVGYAVTSQTAAPPTPDEPAPDLHRPTISATSPPQPGPKIAVGAGPRRPARPGGPVRRGQRHDPQEARLRRPHHRRLPARPRRGRGPWASSSSASTPASATPTSGWSISASRSSSAGVEIRPGDLIHADKHGVCIIPLEIAPRLAEACAEVERLERPLLEICRSDDFDLEEYIALPGGDARRRSASEPGRVGPATASAGSAAWRGWATTTGSNRWLRRTASSGRISSSRLPSAYQRPLRNSKTAVAWRGRSARSSNGSASKWTPIRARKRRVCRSRAQRTSSCQWASSQRSPRRDRSGPGRSRNRASSHSRCWRNELAGLVDVQVLEELPERPLAGRARPRRGRPAGRQPR